nr:MAG TPA: hypothetical protein [Caudoviricetes sp.]
MKKIFSDCCLTCAGTLPHTKTRHAGGDAPRQKQRGNYGLHDRS